MPRPQIDYKLAMAAGMDAANAQMRRSGRTSWSHEDWNLAAKVTGELLDKLNHTGPRQKKGENHMPTYHTDFDKELPTLPEDFQGYIQALEDLLSSADLVLRKRAPIRDLRQAMREAEEAGKQAGRLKPRIRHRKHPDRQPGQNIQPPRECEYCGHSPAYRIVWIDEQTKKRDIHYLCATCDENEIRELEA